MGVTTDNQGNLHRSDGQFTNKPPKDVGSAVNFDELDDGVKQPKRSVSMSSGSVDSVGNYWGWGSPFHRERTSRQGFYFIAGSGHGGYVVNGAAMTDEEKEDIQALGLKPQLATAVVGQNGEVKGLVLNRGRKVSFNDKVVEGYEVYVGEEDCDWAIIELATGVRTSSLPAENTKGRWLEHIKDTVERWACHTSGADGHQPIPERLQALERIYEKQLTKLQGRLDEPLYQQ